MSNIIYTLDQLPAVSDFLMTQAESRLLCFSGDLGAGKTTLVKALVRGLGGTDAGYSPTFGLVNEYRDSKGMLLAYHLDCYRIQDEEEALDIGIEEYLEADSWVFVEWAENIASLLPATRTEICIGFEGPETRRLSLQNLP
jgi:tRNA threonylcarbamoyladenosine biosynthesis protein TsaE